LAWTIEYTDTAKSLLQKLDKPTARRIVDYMDERIAPLDDSRSTGKSLTGPLGGLCRYRVGDKLWACFFIGRIAPFLLKRVQPA